MLSCPHSINFKSFGDFFFIYKPAFGGIVQLCSCELYRIAHFLVAIKFFLLNLLSTSGFFKRNALRRSFDF